MNTISNDYTYEEFLKLSNDILYYSDLKNAIEKDSHRREELKRAKEHPNPRR